MSQAEQEKVFDKSSAKTFYEGVPLLRNAKDDSYFVIQMDSGHTTELLRAHGDNLDRIKDAAGDGEKIGVTVSQEGYVKEATNEQGEPIRQFCPKGFVIGLKNSFGLQPGETSLIGRPVNSSREDHLTVLCNCGDRTEYEGRDGKTHVGHSGVFFNIPRAEVSDEQYQQFRAALADKNSYVTVTGRANLWPVELKELKSAPNFSLKEISKFSIGTRDSVKNSEEDQPAQKPKP